jgi:hypothetical protein
MSANINATKAKKHARQVALWSEHNVSGNVMVALTHRVEDVSEGEAVVKSSGVQLSSLFSDDM